LSSQRLTRFSLFQRVLDILEVRIVRREGLAGCRNRISMLAFRKTVGPMTVILRRRANVTQVQLGKVVKMNE
jgi:hypothetical protein